MRWGKRQGAPFEASWNVSPLLTLSLQMSLRLHSNLWICKLASDWLFEGNIIDCVWRLGDKTQGQFIAKRVGYLITQRCCDDVCPKPNIHSRLWTQTAYRPASSRMGWYWLTPMELWLGLLVPSRLHSSSSPLQNSGGQHTHTVLLAFSVPVFTVCLAISLLHYPQMTCMLIEAFLFCFQICTRVLV